MDAVKAVISAMNGVIWNWPAALPAMVALLLGTGVFLTIRLRFINLRGFVHAIRVVRGDFDDPDDPGDITHFQALTTALSATVGIGNIAGVATAIHYGGPGALFWMWLTAAFGMSTKFTECTLALGFRNKNADGTVSGGPMYYIERKLGIKPLAMFFAACAVISSFGSGNAVQAFTMADSFRHQFHLPTWITGGVSAFIVGLVILGGIKRIGNFTSRIVPLMAVLYFVAAISVLVLNVTEIPAAFVTIVASAFNPASAVGGFAGATFIFTLTWGVKRGLFSNEAGQGSAPIAHAAARTDEPVREGAVALLEPFIDTITICTLTGLVIITTGTWHDTKPSIFPIDAQSSIRVVTDRCELARNAVEQPGCEIAVGQTLPLRAGRVDGVKFVVNHGFVEDPTVTSFDGTPADGMLLVGALGRPEVRSGGRPVEAQLRGATLQNGSPLTAWSFDRGLAKILPAGLSIGAYLVTIAVFLFALSTAIGWSYYGDRSAQYLLGERAVLPYKLCFLVMHFLGAIFSLEVVWGFGDAALGMMSFPNLIAILALSGTVARMSNTYFAKNHVPFAKGNSASSDEDAR